MASFRSFPVIFAVDFCVFLLFSIAGPKPLFTSQAVYLGLHFGLCPSATVPQSGNTLWLIFFLLPEGLYLLRNESHTLGAPRIDAFANEFRKDMVFCGIREKLR